MPSAFGDAVVVTDSSGVPTSVAWTKSAVKENDDQYYELQIRIKVPDASFTMLKFPATQVCRSSEGVETTVEWAAGANEEGEAAPMLAILPVRAPGWNKFQVASQVDDLSAYFGDAQIVWAGDAAYSANATTMELIAAESDVQELSSLKAGTVIWVKY